MLYFLIQVNQDEDYKIYVKRAQPSQNLAYKLIKKKKEKFPAQFYTHVLNRISIGHDLHIVFSVIIKLH